MTTPGSPARLELGGLIRQARESRGLTQAELAALIDRTQPTVQKAERGTVKVQRQTVERIIVVLNIAPAMADRMRELVRQASWVQRWNGERAVVPPYARRFLTDERYAREVLCWHEMRVPGVLQSTPFSLNQFGAAGVTDVLPYYHNREDRKKMFTRPGLERYACILAEEVFRTGFHRWGADVIRDEIDYLLSLRDPRISVQVLPTKTRLVHQHGDFSVLRMPQEADSYVYIEHVGGATYENKPAIVGKAVEEWRKLADIALDRQQTNDLLADLRKEFADG